MTIDQVEKVLLAIAEKKIKLNIMLWGPNGVGKTDVFRSVAQKLKWKFWLEHMPSAERTNVAGIPFTNKHKRKNGLEVLVQELAYPRFIVDAMDGKIVILFDEVNKTPKEVQASILELINERSINGQPLDAEILIGLTGNPPDERNSVKITDTAFNDRVVHVVIQNNVKTTLEFFKTEKERRPEATNLMNKDVLAFLSSHEKEMYEFDERDNEFPVKRRKSSRNWKERVNRIWGELRPVAKEYGISEDTILELIQGTIGEEPATKFIQFVNDNKKPITFEDIILLTEETIQRLRQYGGKTEEGDDDLSSPVYMSILSDAAQSVVSRRDDKKLLDNSDNILTFFSELPDSLMYSTINEFLKTPHQEAWVIKLKETVGTNDKPVLKWNKIVEKQSRVNELEKRRKKASIEGTIKNQNK